MSSETTSRRTRSRRAEDIRLHTKWAILNLLCFPVVAIIKAITAMKKVWQSDTEIELHDTVRLKCAEGFGESYFQCVLQLMIVFVTWRGPDAVQLLSLATSLLSLAFTASTWYIYVQGKPNQDILAKVNLVPIFAMMLSPRLFVIALLCAYLREYGVAIVAVIFFLTFVV